MDIIENIFEEEQVRKLEQLYQEKFGLKSILLDNNYLALQYTDRWIINYLISLSDSYPQIKTQSSSFDSDIKHSDINDPRPEISIIMSHLRDSNKPLGNYYKKLLRKKFSIRAIFDQKTDIQIARAQELINEFPTLFKVRYTEHELKGTTRRIILDGVFATDSIKVPAKSDFNIKGHIPYVGVFYFDDNQKKAKTSFEAWWEHATKIEDI